MVFARSILRRGAEKVPNVFVTFGIEQQFRFVSHPGVMAIAKLLEQKHVCRMRANFSEENIEGMKEFDPELARKAKIAMDNKLPINFQQLEIIEETLPRLLKEKEQLTVAREEVAKLAPGKYELKSDISAVRPTLGQKSVEGTPWELPSMKYPELCGDAAKKISK